jgi:hypothetical protein
MDVAPYAEHYEKRADPWGRAYYWAVGQLPFSQRGRETDLSAIGQGFVTLTPLDFSMTKNATLAAMQSWEFGLETPSDEAEPEEPFGAARTVVRTSAAGSSGKGEEGSDAEGQLEGKESGG